MTWCGLGAIGLTGTGTSAAGRWAWELWTPPSLLAYPVARATSLRCDDDDDASLAGDEVVVTFL